MFRRIKKPETERGKKNVECKSNAERAKKIALKSAPALTLIKSAINKGADMDLDSAALFEIDCFGLCFATEEQNEKMLAFVGKKK